MVRRTDFTENDDDHLLKFIAQVKPTTSGRLGNNLYILLEQSVDQRPWAKRHSWQSWRERYKKNQEWFDYQIKKYQKKIKLYTELFGTSQLSDSGDETSDADEKTSVPKPVVSPGRKPTTTATPQPTRPSQHNRNKPKRKVPDDANFFGTPSPSPLPAAVSSTPRGQPPTLLEGPYQNSLKRARVISGSVPGDEPWPPKRMKKMVEDSPDVKVSDMDAQSRVETKTSGTKNAKSTLVIDKKENVPGSSSRSSMYRLITTPNDGAAALRPARISPVDDDPFIVNKPLHKGQTHASSPLINIIPHDQPPPRVDLRQSLNNHATRRSSNVNSRNSMGSTSTSRHSTTPSLLPEDQEMVNQVGFAQVMADIAKHYGFDVDVAKNAFYATKSIEKTKSVLQHAKEVANSATSDLLAQLTDQSNDDNADFCDDEEPRNMQRGLSLSSGKDQNVNSGHRNTKRSPSSRKLKRLSLNIKKPQPFDDEDIDQNALSDYSPPHASRAGQFMRLVKQGRREEAVNRERQRASGIFVVQTQAPDVDIQDVDIHGDNDNDKDSQPSVETPHEDTVQHQSPDDVPVPVDHRQIFIKRISEGQSTLNEDEDDPAMLKLAQEHRDLVMNVNEENADALRSFEQKNNQDLLRLWSLDWMKQTIANI